MYKFLFEHLFSILWGRTGIAGKSMFNFWRTHQNSATTPLYTPTSKGSIFFNPVTLT